MCRRTGYNLKSPGCVGYSALHRRRYAKDSHEGKDLDFVGHALVNPYYEARQKTADETASLAVL